MPTDPAKLDRRVVRTVRQRGPLKTIRGLDEAPPRTLDDRLEPGVDIKLFDQVLGVPFDSVRRDAQTP
jgi:hypothetical protein